MNSPSCSVACHVTWAWLQQLSPNHSFPSLSFSSSSLPSPFPPLSFVSLPFLPLFLPLPFPLSFSPPFLLLSLFLFFPSFFYPPLPFLSHPLSPPPFSFLLLDYLVVYLFIWGLSSHYVAQAGLELSTDFLPSISCSDTWSPSKLSGLRAVLWEEIHASS